MNKKSRFTVLSIIVLSLFFVGLLDFTNAHAWERRRKATKSGVKESGKAAAEKQVAEWESLSPEEQEYFKEKAKQSTKKAKATGEEYWNSLSADEQQEAIARSKEGAGKVRKRWRELPE